MGKRILVVDDEPEQGNSPVEHESLRNFNEQGNKVEV